MTDRVKVINANQRGSTESGENATRISNESGENATRISNPNIKPEYQTNYYALPFPFSLFSSTFQITSKWE